jgi:hypothetical protein
MMSFQLSRAGGFKAHCVAQAACGCGHVHSTRYGGRRSSMAERVPGCGDAHTRAERLDGSGPAVCRWSEWHEMRVAALRKVRRTMMKLTGRNAALALRRWCEAAEMQAAQTAAIDRLRRCLFRLMYIRHEPSMVEWSSSSWQGHGRGVQALPVSNAFTTSTFASRSPSPSPASPLQPSPLPSPLPSPQPSASPSPPSLPSPLQSPLPSPTPSLPPSSPPPPS